MDLIMLFTKKYLSISDLPMYNWLECNKGNLGYLYHKPKKVEANKSLIDLWTKIYDEYIKEIGLTDDYVELLEAMKKWTIAACDYMIETNSLNGTKEAEAKDLLESLTNKSAGGKFAEFVAAIEKYMGIPIDLHKITVEKFYSYVKLMEKESKQMEAMKHG